ncbi:hypothetical protein VIGAN_05233700 [Vigna angularis var. angularis]|uniref:Uncharacterized protein n=1 Tax=Vigna angularis var. angularis TaxID=157739 RepID=A0A0S3S7B9_PHAAN|nr:hypothetical protein VIGAN_05233700 [Vigna angularis var. angularis]
MRSGSPLVEDWRVTLLILPVALITVTLTWSLLAMSDIHSMTSLLGATLKVKTFTEDSGDSSIGEVDLDFFFNPLVGFLAGGIIGRDKLWSK